MSDQGVSAQGVSDQGGVCPVGRLTFACKTETLGSLYSHAVLAVLILTESQKLKHKVVHEQKFKDLLSSTCQVSVERIVLDLESEAQGPGFYSHWG